MSYHHHCDIGTEPMKRVTNLRELRGVAEDANPGDVIEIEGNYPAHDIDIEVDGTNAKPITFIAYQANFGETSINIEGDWIRWVGGRFPNGQIQVMGDYNRVTRCHFFAGHPGGNSSRLHSAVCVRDAASHNRVDHCLVENWLRRGLRNAYLHSAAKYNLFDHNYLRNMRDGDDRNGREAIQIGHGHSDPQLSPRCKFAFNRIEDFTLESEAVSIKANENLIHFNTFIRCHNASIVSRTGSRNEIYGNFLFQCRGISIFGDDNSVNGNQLNECGPIRVRSGDCNVKQLQQGRFKGGHPAAQRTLVLGNQIKDAPTSEIGVEVGARGRGKREYYDVQHLPAAATELFQNDGQLSQIDKYEGTVRLESYGGEIIEPLRMPPESVGLEAPDPFCDEPNGEDSVEKVREDLTKVQLKQFNLVDEINALSQEIELLDQRVEALEAEAS